MNSSAEHTAIKGSNVAKLTPQLAVWGVGYIGFSSILSFASAGIKAIGIDIDKSRVAGLLIDPERYLPGISDLAEHALSSGELARMVTLSTSYRQFAKLRIRTHLIAVPTERAGYPYFEAIQDVFSKILAMHRNGGQPDPVRIIIESTVSPTALANLTSQASAAGFALGKDYSLAAAPRRDWFQGTEYSLSRLTRVVGASDKLALEHAVEILSVVSPNIVTAQDHFHASLVKIVENSYRHLDITFANELAAAFPSFNLTEVLQLVGTKWNMQTYHPSLGIGGYCVPVAPRYLLDTAEKAEELTLTSTSVFRAKLPVVRLAALIQQARIETLGILGLTYAPNLRVSQESPAMQLIAELAGKGIQISVHDPLYSAQEVQDLTGVSYLPYPDGLEGKGAIVIATPHSLYQDVSPAGVSSRLKACKLLVDIAGIWKDLDPSRHGIDYIQVNQVGWLPFR